MNEFQKPNFLGIFTHTEPIFTMDDQLISLEQCLETNERIRGVQLRIPWKSLQPAQDTMYWDKLERQIEAAASRGKLVHVSIIPGIHTPDWVFEQGAARTGPVTIGGTKADTPILWDPVYVDFFTQLLAQFAAIYGSDPRVTAMHVLGHHYKGDEMHAPKETALLEPYGFSRQTVLDNWRYWLHLYDTLFPDKKLILVVSQMYPGYNDLAKEVAELFVRKFAGRAILQSDQLHGRQDTLGQPDGKAQLSDSIIRDLCGFAPHGHEMVGSFKEQPQRQGSVEMTIYNFIRMGNPLYLQLWRRDCSDTQCAEALLQAWDKYGAMEPDALRSLLQEEGLFVQTSDWNPDQFFKSFKRIDPIPPSAKA